MHHRSHVNHSINSQSTFIQIKANQSLARCILMCIGNRLVITLIISMFTYTLIRAIMMILYLKDNKESIVKHNNQLPSE